MVLELLKDLGKDIHAKKQKLKKDIYTSQELK
jgi:hypothetical protein